jgi:hypothetical protein
VDRDAATKVILATACVSPGPICCAVSGDDAHAAHHPDATSTSPAIEPRMMAMQVMHRKMANAETPAEREALMAEHMATMRMMKTMLADCMPPAAPAR